jgi:[acyl-carrier-protein] S-malonyltransferase
MGKIAFVFPGQGSQQVGMGLDFAQKYPSANEVFQRSNAALGFDVAKLCWEGPEEKLKQTENTQPAILTTSVAILAVLREMEIEPDIVAGHSLGEYTALVAASSISFEDAVQIVRKRGKYMQEAVPLGHGTMAAIMGLQLADIERICVSCQEYGVVEPANINCPGQIVISGEVPAVENAIKLAKEAGAKKSVILPVSAPFHSSLMQNAGKMLEKELERVNIEDPKIPFIANISGDFLNNGSQIQQSLVRQVSSRVLWQQTIERMQSFGVKTFIEVGPGKVLSGFNKKICKELTILHVNDIETLISVLQSVKGGS